MVPRRLATAALLSIAFAPALHAQTATVRLRGTLESVAAHKLVLQERSGQRVELAVAPNVAVNEYFPITLDQVRPGSFVGVGAMPQPDGTQKAIAVLVFPESMRGTGEGHRPFDFLPQSTMTNATVAGEVASTSEGRRLKLTYPGGEKSIVVPPDAPVFSIRPGTRELLAPGARVTVSAQEIGGKPTAVRIGAGRDGFAPPY